MKPNKLIKYKQLDLYQPTGGYEPQPGAPKSITLRPLAGVNYSVPPTELPPGYLSKAQNVRLWEGQVIGRPGMEAFYTTALDSQILLYKELEKDNGTIYLIALTQKSLYYWDTGTSAFVRIPWTSTTGHATTDGSKVVVGSSTAWLANCRAGDRFKIDSKGTYGTIDTVDNDTQITLLANYAASTGAEDYTIDRYFGGTATDKFCSEINDEKFCFSQGVDNILFWDGSATTVAALSADCPACKSMTNFAGRLVLGNTTESGTAYPHRVRWPVLNSNTDWTGTGSGFEDLNESVDPIINLDTLYNQLIVYKRDRIIHGKQTGYTQPAISFFGTKRLESVGLIAHGGLLNKGDVHYFIAEDSIYTYDGSTLTDVGELIRQEFYDQLNPDKADQILTFFIEEFDEWWIFIPKAPSTTLLNAWVLNLAKGTFSTASFATAITAVGYYSRQASYTYDTSPWIFDAAPGRYDDRRGLAGDVMNLVALSTYKTYNFTDEAVDDAGANIDIDIQTPDFTPQYFEIPDGRNLIFTEIEVGYFAAVDETIVVSISVDGGITWEQAQSITFSAGSTQELQHKSITFWITGKAGRVRFQRDGTGRMPNISTLTMFVVDGGKEGR